MMCIRLAGQDDLPSVHSLIHAAAEDLHRRGYDQWPNHSPTLTPERLGTQIARGETYLVTDGDDPIATIAVADEGDPDFWTPDELDEPAVYISKAAVAVNRRGEGIGHLLMRWVIDQAALAHRRWVRLDAWRTNPELQNYYRNRGWEHVRTVELPRRRSGALFQKPAVPDREARGAFTARPSLPGTSANLSADGS